MSSNAAPAAVGSAAALPDSVLALIESAVVTEYATVSAQGVPIDTPTFVFGSRSPLRLDVATGLAYPVKAERARRNPRVGLLLEGGPGEPVVAFAAIAAVRDASIQANADRYIGETIAYYESYSGGNPWSVGRQAVHYWSRIFVECTPQRIWWWPDAASLDRAPQRWDAPAGTAFPASDPAPAGLPSKAPNWPARDWRETAGGMVASGIGAHLTCLSEDGFPMPVRVRAARLVDDGFELELPRGIPWRLDGAATLTYVGLSTFVGRMSGQRLVVERILPTLPMVQDQSEVWLPKESTRIALTGRLDVELARRGQRLPQIPQTPPPPTAGSQRRAARMALMSAGVQVAREG